MSSEETIAQLTKAVNHLNQKLVSCNEENLKLGQALSNYKYLFHLADYEIHIWKVIKNSEGHIESWSLVDANPKALQAWGKNLKEIVGKRTEDIFPLSDPVKMFSPIIQKIFKERRPVTWEYYFPDSDQVLHMISVPFDDYFISTGIDISELKKTQKHLYFVMESEKKRLERAALYDELTQLPNRKLFYDRLDQALREIQRTHDKIAVFFIDIDLFKKINDAFGHELGDSILKHTAHLLSRSVRQVDTVARLGGDEFLVLLKNFQDEIDIIHIADKILKNFEQPLLISNRLIEVSLSIGICHSEYQAHDEVADLFVQRADLAMYQSKKLGGRCYQFFSHKMEVEHQRIRLLETELNTALKNNQFTLHYQPKVDPQSCQVIGYEALLRWDHPQKGLLLPGKFINLCEKNGLIIPIGQFVIQQACKDIHTFMTHGTLPAGGRVSINISPYQFNDPGLFEFIFSCLSDYNIPPSALELEITESLLMKNVSTTLRLLRRFSSAGIQISIDDFGTGYSSLSYLKNLPLSTLKIDKSFISDISKGVNNSEIISAIISLAHKLNLTTIAEGAEQQYQIDFLKENGCDYIQGNYFGEPMSMEQICEA